MRPSTALSPTRVFHTFSAPRGCPFRMSHSVCVTELAPLPADLSRRSFSVKDAHERGLTAGRLRSTDLRSPFTGVRISVAAQRARDNRAVLLNAALDFLPRLRENQFFSHISALAVHGLPVPLRFEGESIVHVGVVYPARAPRARDVCGHQYRIAHLADSTSVRVSPPAVAWREVAGDFSLAELVVVGDALVRRQNPVSSMAELERVVRIDTGRRGTRRLAEALRLVRAGTDSPRESLLRLELLSWGMPEPEVNVSVRDRAGQLLAILDMAYPHYRVAIEYDGSHHFTDARQQHRDLDRYDDLAHLGWRVIRVDRAHLGDDMASTIGRLRRALIERGWVASPFRD